MVSAIKNALITEKVAISKSYEKTGFLSLAFGFKQRIFVHKPGS